MTGFEEIFSDLVQPAEEDASGPKIMVVDDNKEIVDAIRLTLLGRYRVIFCSSLEEALQSLSPEISLVLLDIKMALHDGIECFQKIRAIQPDIRIIFHTAYPGSAEKARLAENLDHDGFLYKGEYSSKVLAETIEAALGRGRASAGVPG